MLVAGRTFTFRVKMVQAPNGLYRIADKVATAAVNGGWIVADGEQTGTLTVNGVTGAAPPLNTETGEVIPATLTDESAVGVPAER